LGLKINPTKQAASENKLRRSCKEKTSC